MHIRPVQFTDVPEIGTIGTRALWDDPVYELLHKYCNQYPLATQYLRRAKTRFYRGATMLMMVTDPQDPEWDGQERVTAYLTLVRNVQDEKTTPSSWNAWLNLQLHWLEDQGIDYLHLDPSSLRSGSRAKAADDRPVQRLPTTLRGGKLDRRSRLSKERNRWTAFEREAQKIVPDNDAGVSVVLLASAHGEGVYRELASKSWAEKTTAET